MADYKDTSSTGRPPRFVRAAWRRRGAGGRTLLFVREDRARHLKLALRITAAVLIVSTLATTAAFAYLYTHYSKVVDERLASGYLTSRAGLYAAPRVLRPGQRLTKERLSGVLRRAGYVDGEAGKVWSGSFSADERGVEILPGKASPVAAAQGFRAVRVEFNRKGQIDALRADGAELDYYALDPEALTDDASVKTGDRKTLSYEDLPPQLVNAILSIEDRRFFEHGPLDLWGIARAALSWGAEEQDFKQGGSTITQQLVKNTYLGPERTLRRKFHEAALASVIERRISKRDILALYCNEIYLGQRGSIAVRGVGQAARVFFGKELKDLTLAESATIAGMIQSPGRYAPDRHADAAQVRRNTVLAAMLRDKRITQEEARAASIEPVRVAAAEQTDATAPYFIDYAERAVESRLGQTEADAQNLRVYTTIDLELQQLAEEAVGRQLERLGKVFKNGKRPQAALVALDPQTGHVLAMVGGSSYAESQLNRATDARRQPGSVFKPVVFAAAMEGGVSPLTTAMDAPQDFTYGHRAHYRPANYGGGYSMREVTLRTALVRSLNVVTVDAAMRAGLTRVSTLAGRLGLPKPEPYPSLALGTTEATPLEVATAYAAFANGGRVVRPTPVVAVDGGRRPAPFDEGLAEEAEQVLKPSTAYMLTDALAAVIDRGTARAARGAFKGLAVAGKTGTARDGWFAGYTPNMVCVVWVGFDDGEELGLTGADSALPVWTEFVRRAVELRPELGGEHFDRPDSVTAVEIDPETGALATAACPQRERVAVTPAFAPGHECTLHGGFYNVFASLETTAPAQTLTAEAPRPAYAAQPAAEFVEEGDSRPTQVVVGRDGRRTLTNEPRVTGERARGAWQE
ncbi:MAG TPA: PBP1A family penicillin-binding protein [Pyrinomonadaceae bacterium]|jgi:penicillin-binding protein 1B|nr:PBP1A family penicillin-binding protein [Pyrinomonadaceae bacterium]